MKTIMLTNEQIAAFCMALEHLIHAGIGAGDALTLLKEDEQDPAYRQLLAQMAQKCDAGVPLSAAVGESERFPAYVAALLQVGERSGKIEQTLQALARYYENRERLERHMRSALLYPLALTAVLLVVAVVLLVWVLPVFDDVYARLGSSLTGLAGALLAFGRVLGKALPMICAAVGLLAAAFAVNRVRRWLLYGWNRLFGDRGVNKKVLSARFVHALTMAVSSGMTHSEALQLACVLTQGEAPAFKKRCRECCTALENGQLLAAALHSSGFLTASDCRLLDAGRRSGREEMVLQQVAQRLLEQSEEALERSAGLVEPAVVAGSCLLIGGVLLSVMLPLMHIMNAIG